MTSKQARTENTATLYRMVIKNHLCPFGVKAKYLLEKHGFDIDDQHLTSREGVNAFKAHHGVKTTPLIYINGQKIGGFDDLQAHLGATLRPSDSISYQPVVSLFSISALLAIAISWIAAGTVFVPQTIGWFIAVAMVLLGLQKLQNLEKFATLFLTYDLLAQKWPRYGYIYPFIETGAGLLMLMGVMTWFSAPAALLIAGIGAVSVFKAVYLDKRVLQCACVGDSRVPLGFISLTENLMMLGMALWMLNTLFR